LIIIITISIYNLTMKFRKIIFGLILFLISGNIIAQNFEKLDLVELTILDINNNYKEPRTSYYWWLNGIQPLKSSPSSFYPQPKLPPLKDTITTDFCFIDYTREFKDRLSDKGDIYITFNLNSESDYYKKEYYLFYDSVKISYDANTEFTADWFLPFSKNPEGGVPETDQICLDIINDSIFTIVNTNPVGGTTPEGQSFSITGKEVLKVSAETKAVFSVDQIYSWDVREEWTKLLYLLETPWEDSSTGNNSYRLPVLRNLRLSKDTFTLIKKKAIEAQRELLIEKRDSILSVRKSYGEASYLFTKRVFDNLKKRLKPNFEDANTPDELYTRFELKYFITRLTVYYKDGTSKKINHIALYTISVT